MKFFFLFILLAPFLSRTKSDWFPTTTRWTIRRQSADIMVECEISGTCVTTGTYTAGCAAPADAVFIPFSPSTISSTVSLIPTCYIRPDAACPAFCATKTCTDFAVATNCFCTRAGDIGYCMVRTCGIAYPDATSIAIEFCSNNSRLSAIFRLLIPVDVLNPGNNMTFGNSSAPETSSNTHAGNSTITSVVITTTDTNVASPINTNPARTSSAGSITSTRRIWSLFVSSVLLYRLVNHL